MTQTTRAPDWNAAAYSRFEAERTRPARDLLAAVALDAPARVVDLGCGPGNSTALLVDRFGADPVTGVDSSPDMLAKARARLPGVRFEAADIGAWRTGAPVDLLYANASLQWLPGHEALFPRLAAMLALGGVLAVQMPDNLDEPSHVAMRRVAEMGPWRDRLADAAAARARILTPRRYVEALDPLCVSVDVWRTTYHHRLEGVDAIVDWFRTSGLRPYVDPLPKDERAAFLAAYREEIAPAYPAFGDGSVLLAFPRLFIVATRRR
jgi:trans-aconitate 2-methyltransferase